jgi:hypothetical protein
MSFVFHITVISEKLFVQNYLFSPRNAGLEKWSDEQALSFALSKCCKSMFKDMKKKSMSDPPPPPVKEHRPVLVRHCYGSVQPEET